MNPSGSKKSKVEDRYLGRVEVDGEQALSVISLFTGCGGFDVGTGWAGFHTRVMVEWDKNCCDTLRANFTKAGWEKHSGRGSWPPSWCKDGIEPAILHRDITKTTTEEILAAGNLRVGQAMLLTGGFPCQGFSTAGKRVIDDPRNVLYKECVRVIREALPKTFCLENVPGLASMAKGEVIRQICEDLADSGYDLSWDILNAADYGVPQNRKRILFIGKRIDQMSFNPEWECPRLIMAPYRGEITYPEWFIKKYRDRNPHADKNQGKRAARARRKVRTAHTS